VEGYAVLVGVAAVGMALLVLLFWFAIALIFHPPNVALR
jgi:hypothetical protein